MSALRTEISRAMGYAGLRMSADEYLALGENAERYELLEGIVTISPSPSLRHQKLVMALIRQLDRHAQKRGGDLLPDIDLHLSTRLVYRPDLVYYEPGRLSEIAEKLATPPDLVVEILSPGSKPLDLITKRDDYDRFGVGEYWVIDPADGQICCWQRTSDAKQMMQVPVEGSRLCSTGAPGFTLNLTPARALCGGPKPKPKAR